MSDHYNQKMHSVQYSLHSLESLCLSGYYNPKMHFLQYSLRSLGSLCLSGYYNPQKHYFQHLYTSTESLHLHLHQHTLQSWFRPIRNHPHLHRLHHNRRFLDFHPTLLHPSLWHPVLLLPSCLPLVKSPSPPAQPPTPSLPERSQAGLHPCMPPAQSLQIFLFFSYVSSSFMYAHTFLFSWSRCF